MIVHPCDTVAYGSDLYAIDTSNKALLLSCSSAWHKYQLDLEQKKKDAMKDIVTRKRKAVDDEIQSLKRRNWDCQLTLIPSLLQPVSRKDRKLSFL